jgi:hypothetical protein
MGARRYLYMRPKHGIRKTTAEEIVTAPGKVWSSVLRSSRTSLAIGWI